jgi:hypothetical protein
MEEDAARIQDELGRPDAARVWRERAKARRAAIDRYLWDAETGLYFDYNFETKKRRPYEFATTFYPLWVGAASPEQARRVRDNLSKFEASGGILTSTRVTGHQWDAPFGWAPLQMIAVAGLRRYGFEDDADRIARKFLELVTKEFEEHAVILEKYDLRRRESDVAADIRFGYSSNEIGFGWTNAAYLELLAGLRADARAASTHWPVAIDPRPLRRPARPVRQRSAGVTSKASRTSRSRFASSSRRWRTSSYWPGGMRQSGAAMSRETLPSELGRIGVGSTRLTTPPPARRIS